ncbi:MAG TPA: leucyl aminopeptidase family protein [Pseudonocardiaceae bacterium]|jgi:leucyl aminopeptidase|nr:leucyl aminopeptidase family protein [Pseudonocardiaceae bacterium]
MAVRTPTAPPVPTPLVRVELADRTRRGAAAPVAVISAPADGSGTPELGPEAAELLAGWDEVARPTGRAGEVHGLPALNGSGPAGWVVGIGVRRPVDWRGAGAALLRAIQRLAEAADHPRTLDLRLPADVGTDEIGALVLGIMLGGYQFRVTGDRARPAVRTVRLRVDAPTSLTAGLAAAVRRAGVLASATALARDLANMPSNIKDPDWLARTAVTVASAAPGLTAVAHDERWLAQHRFGGVLAVGGGSVRPPRLVELTWRPAGAAKTPHLVLVGKGITFDTGGISIKPAAGMHLMRTDMSGGAAVIAALRAIAELDLPVRVTGLVPIAENHVSGSAYRPGDVVRQYGGRTTEITNTDAEGRLVLADALAYATATLKPDALVDVATLTGAMKVALGLRTGGLFASADDLAERIDAAGGDVGESWWRMPLLDTHAEDVASDVADLRQCPPGPGGITAALFLREFTAGLPWAHLDIAGPARADSAYAEVVPGGTGFGARSLVALAESFARSYSN